MANIKTATKKANIDLEAEVRELHVLLRALGEQAIMMRDGGKLAEKEKTYSGNIVTEADHLLEQKIIKHLWEQYPTHRVRGEQSGATGSAESAYEWIVNPIDGTTNFSRGLKFFSIAIGLLHNGVPVMGLVYFPELSRFVYAIKGKGVHDNGKPLKIFERPPIHEMRRALVAMAISKKPEGRLEVFQAARSKSANIVNMGSVTYNCVLLAERKIDAVIHPDATLFNIAAAIPILEESGCVMSGFEAGKLDLKKEPISVIFAENKKLLEDIKKSLSPHWKANKK